MGLTKEAKAKAAGLQIWPSRSDYRTPCPVCSPNRRKKKDPCLHVTIKPEAILASCFHCDFKGAYFDDQSSESYGHKRQTVRHAPRRLERARWW